MRKYLTFQILMIACSVNAQITSQDSVETRYFNAYQELNAMLTDSIVPNFKKAVFLTENAFYDNSIRYDDFQTEIDKLAKIVLWFKDNTQLEYDGDDKEDVEKWAALFTIMTQKMLVPTSDTTAYIHQGFEYDFDDYWGEKDWTKQFVMKLLYSGKGNCHSLPFLYKIVAEEIGTTAHLALAPHHIYIKHQSKEWGWYNSELTSASFPIDAWITTSSYVNFDAIRSKMYMDTLSAKQSIGVCVIDLAEGYKRRVKNPDLNFLLSCANTALKYDSTYANALLLKAETLKSIFENELSKRGIEKPDYWKLDDYMKGLFIEMESTYANLLTYGYLPMPKEMYLQWLKDLTKQKEKYQNKAILTKLPSDDN